LIKDKQPTSFEDNKLPKPSSSSEHMKPRLIIETDDLIPPPLGKGLSQSVQLRSTLHTLGLLHPVGASAKEEERKRKEERKTAVIHPFDVQRLILRALLGNDHKPRWCKLKCQKRLAKVVTVVVDNVTAADWYRHKDSCPNLTKLSKREGSPVELNTSTSGDAEKLRRLFHSVPLTISDLKQFNEGVNHDYRVQNGKEKKRDQNCESNEANASGTDAEITKEPKDSPKSHWKERLVAKTLASDAKRALETDGLVTWVDLKRHSDVFKRTFLLLNTNDMIADNIPTPYTVNVGGDGVGKGGYWTLGLGHTDVGENGRDSDSYIGSNGIERFEREHSSHPIPYYLPVTPSSPLYAIDVEMCRGADGALVPVWIAVVDEKLRHLYSSLIRPTQRIVDYLTPYSGVTKAMLKDVTTTMADVARDLRRLLPGDAVLVGHQIGCDLESLKLVHPYVVDTVKILNLKGDPDLKSKLRDLTRNLLGRNIQEFAANEAIGEEGELGVNGMSSNFSTSSSSSCSSSSKKLGHNPVEDARATMELVLLKLRNHPMFGNLGYPAGVMPNEWQTMPVKFLKWYEKVAASQKAMRAEMSEGEENVSCGAVETGGVAFETATAASNGATPSVVTTADPSTPCAALSKVLTLSEDRASLSPTRNSWSSPSSSNPRLSIEEAFDSTSEIFPSVDVGSLLAEDGVNTAEYTVGSESEITLDILQGSLLKYTSFVIKDSRHCANEPRSPGKEDFLRRVDRCVGKIAEYLPKHSLINVVLSEEHVSVGEKVGERKSEDTNGLVLVDIL